MFQRPSPARIVGNAVVEENHVIDADLSPTSQGNRALFLSKLQRSISSQRFPNNQDMWAKIGEMAWRRVPSTEYNEYGVKFSVGEGWNPRHGEWNQLLQELFRLREHNRELTTRVQKLELLLLLEGKDDSAVSDEGSESPFLMVDAWRPLDKEEMSELTQSRGRAASADL
jgi:hypothetical protein